METIRVLLETQVLFTVFLTIAVGYLVGEINIKGFSLGSGAVLFVGLIPLPNPGVGKLTFGLVALFPVALYLGKLPKYRRR